MWHSGQQVQMEFGRNMTAQRYPMCFGERRRLAPGRDAADPEQVEDQDIYGPRL